MIDIKRSQTIACHAHGGLSLPGFMLAGAGVKSPYFQTKNTARPGKTAPGRNITISAAMKAYIDNYIVTASGTSYVGVTFIDDSSGNAFVENAFIPTDFSADTSSETIFAQAQTDILAYAVTKGYSVPVVFGMFATTNGHGSPVASALSISLVSGTGATGTQISTTQNAWVAVAGSVSTSATIGGASSGDIILEVAPTNSATPSDWVEWGRIGNSQTITLAIALQSIQVIKGQMMAFVPAGYYVKARTLTGSGTPTYALLEAKEIVL